MPPRATKKAVAKKPSPKVKGTTPPLSTLSSEAPSTISEGTTDPEVVAHPDAGEKSPEAVTVPDPAVKEEAEEEDADPPAAVQQSDVLKSEVEEEEVAEERVDSEAAAEKVQGSADSHPDGVEKGDDDLSGGDNSGSDDNAHNEENEDDDPSLYMQPPLTERKKQKEFELFVGGLNKEAVEDDLTKVFSVFGDIQSVRIVKHPSTQKSKGFAFVRYATIEHTEKALAELKDGVEVRGKLARVSASQDNDTLYMGNICKTWTRDHVLETLKGFGVEQIENILLPDDPKNEGKIKGFAFLEFSSHSDAMAAFQRLRKPDVVFGCDRSAKVAFTTSMHPSEEALLEVKTVFVEGIPESWDEEKVKDLCKQYGEIEKVQLSRNLNRNKRKDFGFVEFTSRGSAVACVEGINNADLGEEETKVKANLAKPQNKGRLAKQAARGGFIINKDGEVTEEAKQSKKKKNPKSKEVLDKGRNPKGSQPSKFPAKVTEGKGGSQAAQPVKGKKRGGRGVDTVTNERPSKKARDNQNYGNMRGRPSNSFGNQRKHFGMPKVNYGAHPTTYAPSYVQSAAGYQAHAYAGSSGSKRRHSDLEPHGGYLPAAKQVQYPYGNDQIRAGAYNNQPGSGSGFVRAAPIFPPSYSGYPHYAGYEAGYGHPSSGASSYAARGGYY